jgi:uncharacterized membrane protein
MKASRELTQHVKARGTGAAALILLLLVLLASAAAAQTTLNYPGGKTTIAFDINDVGTIVGSYYDSSGSEHGFLYDGIDFTTFDYPGADWTEAAGINQAGDVVGYYGYNTDNLMHGFLRTAAKQFSAIDRNGRFNTMPEGINSSGIIVGCMHNPGTMHGWVVQDGAFTSISPAYGMYTGVNDAGTIVGWFSVPGSNRSFVLSGAGRVEFDYPNATNTQAQGLNAHGDVVGWHGPVASSRGFLLHDGNFTEIQVSGATWTRAFGINAAGTIVGAYKDATNAVHGFVW